MRTINYLVIHCTATQPNAKISSIQNYWKNELKWKNPGYHYIIESNGNVVQLLPIEQISNGVGGWNSQLINISYVGGVDFKGNPKDTRTEAQKDSILKLLKDLKKRFPNAKIQGHRDFLQRGKKGWKECPSFDVKSWLASVNFEN